MSKLEFPGSRLRHRVRGSPIQARPSCALPQFGSRERHHQDVPMASPARGPKWPLRSTRRSHHLIWRVFFFFKPNAKLINVQYRGVGRHSSIGDPPRKTPKKLYIMAHPFFQLLMFLWSADYYWWTPRSPPGLLSSDVPASETPDNMYQQAPTPYIHTYVPIYTPIRSSVTVCTVWIVVSYANVPFQVFF